MKVMRRILLSLMVAVALHGQRLDPVQWALTSDTAKAPPVSTVGLRLTAKIDAGWHLYSLTTPAGGPIVTTAGLAENPALGAVTIFQPKPNRKLDPNFGIDTETFTDELPLLLSAQLSKDAAPGEVELKAQVRYQACDDRQCLPPRKKEATYSLTVDPAAPAAAALTLPAGYTDIRQTPSSTGAAPSDSGLLGFALTAFGLGLAAIFTPCVFPMIPITVSFFLGQRGGILQAIVFSLGIVLHQLVAGTRPFDADDWKTAAQRIRHDPAPPLRAGAS